MAEVIIGAYYLTGTAMSAAGFTSSGIAASSMAAAWHSSIGNAVAGSAFSTLQSAGVTGAAQCAAAGTKYE